MAQKKLIFLYLALFPFGQLFRTTVLGITIQPVDILVLAASLIFLLTNFEKIVKENYKIKSVVFILFFSLISSAFVSFSSSLYFIRLVSYLIFLLNINNLCRADKNLRKLLIRSLALVGLITAVFGWIQYLIIPDLRPLFILGWDDHYYRLTGTFLDPAFTGIILVLTFIIFAFYPVIKNKIIKFLTLGFIFISIGFTYSRSSILALFCTLVFALLLKSKKKLIILFTGIVLAMLIVLPRASSEGTNFFRTASINLKIKNYETSINIIKKYPVFGIGYDAVCNYKRVNGLDANLESHSCSGLDNSFLFIWAATGIAGVIMFLWFGIKMFQTTDKKYKDLILYSGVAVLVHSLFTNTLFYAWILGWFAVLLGVTRNNIKT